MTCGTTHTACECFLARLAQAEKERDEAREAHIAEHQECVNMWSQRDEAREERDRWSAFWKEQADTQERMRYQAHETFCKRISELEAAVEQYREALEKIVRWEESIVGRPYDPEALKIAREALSATADPLSSPASKRVSEEREKEKVEQFRAGYRQCEKEFRKLWLKEAEKLQSEREAMVRVVGAARTIVAKHPDDCEHTTAIWDALNALDAVHKDGQASTDAPLRSSGKESCDG